MLESPRRPRAVKGIVISRNRNSEATALTARFVDRRDRVVWRSSCGMISRRSSTGSVDKDSAELRDTVRAAVRLSVFPDMVVRTNKTGCSWIDDYSRAFFRTKTASRTSDIIYTCPDRATKAFTEYNGASIRACQLSFRRNKAIVRAYLYYRSPSSVAQASLSIAWPSLPSICQRYSVGVDARAS